VTAVEIKARLVEIDGLLADLATKVWLLQQEQVELRQTLRSINARADADAAEAAA
jgi:hypothetical protein